MENQEQHHYQKDWRLIHRSLNWTWDWVYYWMQLIDYNHVPFIIILGVQEQHHCLQHWRLIHHLHNWNWKGVSWLNVTNRLIFNHASYITKLDFSEQDHYRRHWRSIHHLFNWIWTWDYNGVSSTDYYSITFYFKQYWFRRSNIIIRSIEG